MPFEIGNKAAAKGRRFEQMLERAIKGDDAVRLRRACEALLDKAADGDLNAIGMIRDTLDGKPKQQVDVKADNTLTVVLAQTLEDGSIATLPAQGLTIDQAPEPVQHNDLQAISSVDTLHQEE